MTDTKAWKSCFRSDLFVGKVALVTGGGTGIGKVRLGTTPNLSIHSWNIIHICSLLC